MGIYTQVLCHLYFLHTNLYKVTFIKYTCYIDDRYFINHTRDFILFIVTAAIIRK